MYHPPLTDVDPSGEAALQHNELLLANLTASHRTGKGAKRTRDGSGVPLMRELTQHGRREVEKVQAWFATPPARRPPLVMVGASGTGKRAVLMACAARHAAGVAVDHVFHRYTPTHHTTQENLANAVWGAMGTGCTLRDIARGRGYSGSPVCHVHVISHCAQLPLCAPNDEGGGSGARAAVPGAYRKSTKTPKHITALLEAVSKRASGNPRPRATEAGACVVLMLHSLSTRVSREWADVGTKVRLAAHGDNAVAAALRCTTIAGVSFTGTPLPIGDGVGRMGAQDIAAAQGDMRAMQTRLAWDATRPYGAAGAKQASAAPGAPEEGSIFQMAQWLMHGAPDATHGTKTVAAALRLMDSEPRLAAVVWHQRSVHDALHSKGMPAVQRTRGRKCAPVRSIHAAAATAAAYAEMDWGASGREATVMQAALAAAPPSYTQGTVWCVDAHAALKDACSKTRGGHGRNVFVSKAGFTPQDTDVHFQSVAVKQRMQCTVPGSQSWRPPAGVDGHAYMETLVRVSRREEGVQEYTDARVSGRGADADAAGKNLDARVKWAVDARSSIQEARSAIGDEIHFE